MAGGCPAPAHGIATGEELRAGQRGDENQVRAACACPKICPDNFIAAEEDISHVNEACLLTLLFVPGNRPERFAKARSSGADAVCIDLEDAVPEPAKGQARESAVAALACADLRPAVRINGLKTRAGLEDLLALTSGAPAPQLLLIPKVESADEVAIITSVMGGRRPGLVPLIETARGLAHAAQIASAPGVVALMLGGGDLAAELGVALAWEPLRTARGLLILACATAGVAAIDVPYTVLDDEAGLVAETRAARQLGFTAKAAIHPAQIAPMRAVLAPSPEEVAEAEEAQRVFVAAAGAAVRFKGRMLEAPIMRRYRRILAMQRPSHA